MCVRWFAVACVYVCACPVWEKVQHRACCWAHQGAAGKMQAVIQAAEWVSCPFLGIQKAASWNYLLELKGLIQVSKPIHRIPHFSNKQHSVDIFTRRPFPAGRAFTKSQQIHVLISAGTSPFKKACVMEYPVSCHISRLLYRLAGRETAKSGNPRVCAI